MNEGEHDGMPDALGDHPRETTFLRVARWHRGGRV
jgi:hypothetical protein